MPNELTTITGLAEVQRMLDEAPGVIVLVAFQKSLAAGGEVIARQLFVNTPEREDENTRPDDQKPLRECLITDVQLDSRFRGGQVQVGFSGFGGRIANWLEYGHRIVSSHPTETYTDDRGRVRKGHVGGFVPGIHFMAKTADAAMEPAVEAFQEALVEALQEVL